MLSVTFHTLSGIASYSPAHKLTSERAWRLLSANVPQVFEHFSEEEEQRLPTLKPLMDRALPLFDGSAIWSQDLLDRDVSRVLNYVRHPGRLGWGGGGAQICYVAQCD